MQHSFIWPADYDPARSPVHAVNRLDIAAAPSVVWSLLIHPQHWSSFYGHASNARIVDGHGELALGRQFVWETAGVELTSTVKEFVPNERLAWDALYESSRAYHAWLIVPTAGGCHVLTEETQQGPYWEALASKHRKGLYEFHQEWLEGLAKRAEAA